MAKIKTGQERLQEINVRLKDLFTRLLEKMESLTEDLESIKRSVRHIKNKQERELLAIREKVEQLFELISTGKISQPTPEPQLASDTWDPSKGPRPMKNGRSVAVSDGIGVRTQNK